MNEERLSILLLEDEPAHAAALRRVFEAAGTRVRIEVAGTLREYRRIIAKNLPDVAVVDLNLPDGRAVEILTRPPEDGLFPILLMTSFGNEHIAVEAIKSGALDYIVKSAEAFAAMPRTVERAMREWKLLQERKRAEDALRKSEERYRNIFENAIEGIFQVTQEGRYLTANPALARMLGYSSPEELISTVIDMANQIHVDPDERKEFIRLLNEKGGIAGFEMQLQRKDRSIVWSSTNARVVRDERGKILYHEGTSEDITERKRTEEKLTQSLAGLRMAVATTIQVMVSAVETKDPYTAGHQRRVTHLALTIAKEMDIPDDVSEGIRMAGAIHDIGKISVPAEILSKPIKLSDIEFSLIMAHAQYGYDILKNVESQWPLARIVLQHHERMNGSGYPMGMRDGEILLEARIIAVADVVESMASHRPYRPALGIGAALDEIEKNKGVLYDPAVVEACLRVFREKAFNL